MTGPDGSFPPELRLLLALLRAAVGGDFVAPPPDEALRWPLFITLVERHRVGACLHRRAAPALATCCPPEVIQRIGRIAAATTRDALGRTAEQVRLVRCLEAAGIPVVAVKGLVLAQELHGHIAARPAGDIDLLVPVADVARADALLQSTGLHRSRPDFALTPRQTAEYLRVMPDFEYRRENPPTRIELLWRLEGLPATAAAWDRLGSARLGGQVMRTLPPDLNALYLFLHGARHGWFRLFWLVDVALLLRDPGSDWAALLAQARRDGVTRPLLQGAALAEQLLGVPCPAALRPSGAETPRIAALAAEARRQITRPVREHESIAEWTRQLAYRVRLQTNARAKFATLAPHLFSPESWRIWPLPDRWFFLYAFATPFLWLWRRARR